MQRQWFVAIGVVTARVALSCAVGAVSATALHAQNYGTTPYPPRGGAASDDPIQPGRDGMRILGTITVPPGGVQPDTTRPGATRAPMIDEEDPGALSADRMAWSEAAKHAYAARQYAEARSLFHRAAQSGNSEAQMMLGQMAERGQGGPQDLEEALGWYAAAARNGVGGAAQKVTALTDQLRRQAAQNVAAAPSSEEGTAQPGPARRGANAPANRRPQPPPRAQARAGSEPSTPRQKRAESLTPRPAPEVTEDSKPVGDMAQESSDAGDQSTRQAQEQARRQAEKDRQQAEQAQQQAQKQQQAEQARQQAQKEQKQAEQARQQAQKEQQQLEQARQQAQKKQQQAGQAQQLAQKEPAPEAKAPGPQTSVPEWPGAAPKHDAKDASRGASADEQEASLPESLQPPKLSEPIAQLPKRAPPALSPEAKTKLDQARAFESGKGAAKNEAKAVELYRAIADQSPEAAFDLGWRYSGGRGVKRNDKEAVRYYRMAADKGYAPAQNNLGVLLADGRGVTRNEEEAVDWYRRAALQNFAPAQVNLALMYGKGRGVAQSDANSMAWYSRAAKSGYGPATASLAMMYSEGRGVPQDQKTADFLMESAKGASPASTLVSVEP